MLTAEDVVAKATETVGSFTPLLDPEAAAAAAAAAPQPEPEPALAAASPAAADSTAAAAAELAAAAAAVESAVVAAGEAAAAVAALTAEPRRVQCPIIHELRLRGEICTDPQVQSSPSNHVFTPTLKP